MRWMALGVVLATLGACGGSVGGDRRAPATSTPADAAPAAAYSSDDLARAVTVAWAAYGPTGLAAYPGNVSPPRIEWVTGAALDCASGTGYVDPGDGGCYGGQFFPGSYSAKVSVVPGRSLSADGVLAHEFGHAVAGFAHYWTDGAASDSDPTHVGRAFCDAERGCMPTLDDEAPSIAGWSKTVSAQLGAAGL